MSRAILVIGPQGSGSSAIAGSLHALGISMGSRLKGSSNLNPKGHFECLDFEDLFLKWINKDNITISDFPFMKQKIKDYVLKRNEEGLWGLKMPIIIFLASYMIPYIEDCRVISIDRPFEACVKSSIVKYADKSRDFIEDMHNNIRISRKRLIERYDLKNINIDFNDFTSNTKNIMTKIIEFCFEGKVFPSESKINEAISFVDPNLNHRREL